MIGIGGGTVLEGVYDVSNYGARGNGITDDSAAIQAAINAAAKVRGGTVILSGMHAASGLTLPNDVTIVGNSMPGVDVANSPLPHARGFIRNADQPLFSIIGTNRITNRIGRNMFSGVLFQTVANISATPWLNCKYADSLEFFNCLFWNVDNQATAGHTIAAEECWDWRFYNTYWKHFGNVAKTTYAIYVFNGQDDSCNDWQFVGCRWQEGVSTAFFFDSSGAGNANAFFWWTQCKFEDTTNASGAHIDGVANSLFWNQSQFGGAGVAQINMPAAATDWNWSQCLFANGGAIATEMVTLVGNRSSITQSRFNSPGAGVVQYVNVIGNENEITGNARSSTAIPLVNTGLPATSKIHNNLDYTTEYSSTAQITAAATSIVVNHNLSYTPANHVINVTPATNIGTATKYWVSAVGATTFTINVDVAPGAIITFLWQANRLRG